MNRKYTIFTGLVLLSFLLGCSGNSPTPLGNVNNSRSFGTCTPVRVTSIPTGFVRETPPPDPSPAPIQTDVSENTSAEPVFGYTHQRPDGNRYVHGKGQIPDQIPIEILLPDNPVWVVAIPFGTGSLWAVTLENGRVLGFQVENGKWKSTNLNPPQIAAGQPPLLVSTALETSLLLAPSASASVSTHPISFVDSGYSQVFVDSAGNLIPVDINKHILPPLELSLLPDARILVDEREFLLFLTGATDRYAHGVLGDALEADGFTLISGLNTGQQTTISMPGDFVIEGIAPIWVDWDGDGNQEIIVTVSDANQGAQILMFNESGEQIAAGPAIGQGYRWRHQIAVAPFGPRGEMELVDVLTPHLGGIVEFYQWEGKELKIVAQLPGYTSHVIGTRNLDMAAAGDFDGDGEVELLLPRQDRLALGAIRRTHTGADVAWSLPLDAKLLTNIGAVTLADGSIAVGVGQENGILTIWHP